MILSRAELGYRADIDGMRALAVTIVILFHLDVSWLPGGFVGVDVFFVISGFLITSLIARQIEAGNFSIIDFYERRFRRIYPNLLIVLAATTTLGWFTLMPETYRFFGRTLAWASLSASNFAFIGGGGYFDPDNITKPLLHTWSLGVEEQFYLIFPWLLILAIRFGYRTTRLVGGTIMLSLALSIGAAIAGWSSSYFLLPTRFWELGIGALVAVLPTNGHMRPLQRAALGLTGLAGIIWAALSLSESDSFPGYLALAPTLGTAALIVANGGPINKLMALRPFAWIGRLSYALYLWHWPLISVAAGAGLLPKETITRVAVVVLSFLLSIIGYYLWEKPIRYRRLLPGRKNFFILLFICVSYFVCMGIIIFSTRGLPQRLPEKLAGIYINTKKDSQYILKYCSMANSNEPYSCAIGDKSSNPVSFVVVGDSHSEAVAAEIGDIAALHGLRGLYLGKTGCMGFIEIEADKDCIRQIEYAKNVINETNPFLIINVSRWAHLVAPSGTGSIYNVNPNRRYFGEFDQYKFVESQIESEIKSFGKREIVTALTTPEYEENIPQLLLWRQILKDYGLPTIPPQFSINIYYKRQIYIQKIFNDIKEKYTNFHIIDPATVFCPQGICTSVLDNKPLYYDDDHLSHAGALLYASLFEPYLEDLAQRLAPPATSSGATDTPAQTGLSR